MGLFFVTRLGLLGVGASCLKAVIHTYQLLISCAGAGVGRSKFIKRFNKKENVEEALYVTTTSALPQRYAV